MLASDRSLFSRWLPLPICLLGGALLSLCAHAQRIDALPRAGATALSPSASAPLDLGALAQQFAQSPGGKPDTAPRLRVFISLSMPQPTLARLGEQAQRSRSILVLRGLVEGSLTLTVGRLHEVFGSQLPALQIDPQSFERFQVKEVPSFVLTQGELPKTCADEKTCAQLPAPPFVKVAGDVSLDYALAHMAAQMPAMAATVQSLMRDLKRRAPASRPLPGSTP